MKGRCKIKTWTKFIVTINTVESDVIDLISNSLFELGSIGVEVDYAHGYLENHPNLFGEILEEIPKERLEHDTEIIAYFEEDFSIEIIDAQISHLLKNYKFSINKETQEDEQWQTNWMKHYQPQHISRYLSIVPVWVDDYQAQQNESVIYLDPGVAFGTGNHPTTQLGAQALELVLRGGETVLDVGTGSGVLAFVAKQLGAKKIYGYDLDPQAIESAKLNLTYQKDQSDIEFEINNLLVDIDHRADVIVANILPHILIHLFDDAAKLLNPGGSLILGGIMLEKSEELEKELALRDWELVQKTIRYGWVSLILKKKGE